MPEEAIERGRNPVPNEKDDATSSLSLNNQRISKRFFTTFSPNAVFLERV